MKMTDRTITLRSDLVERLETLAGQQGRSIDEVFGELLENYAFAEQHTQALVPSKPARRSLLGLWAGVRVSDEDIDEARREMWDNFPREDV